MTSSPSPLQTVQATNVDDPESFIESSERKASLLCACPKLIRPCRVQHRCCLTAECLSGTRRAVGRSRPEGATGGDEAREGGRNETNGKLRVSGLGTLLLGDAVLSWSGTRMGTALSVFLLLAELTGLIDSFTRELAGMHCRCPQLRRLLFARD